MDQYFYVRLTMKSCRVDVDANSKSVFPYEAELSWGSKQSELPRLPRVPYTLPRVLRTTGNEEQRHEKRERRMSAARWEKKAGPGATFSSFGRECGDLEEQLS